MILSVSRRTDIPAFYSEWFINRIKAGYVYVRNPFNTKKISKVNIAADVVDCIVFWSKNPRPLLENGGLQLLDDMGYSYYFQITVTPYGKDLESYVDKNDIIDTVAALSVSIGKNRVIVRYDPIIITDKYSAEFHEKAFARLCDKLQGRVRKLVISFYDEYAKTKKRMQPFGLKMLTESEMKEIAATLANIADKFGMKIETCAEKIDLSEVGIMPTKCIDRAIVEEISGCRLKLSKAEERDGQRDEACGCMKCIDIGQYDTCLHGCLYCYANTAGEERIKSTLLAHDSMSPVLAGAYDENRVIERKKDVVSYREKHGQISILPDCLS